MQDLLTRGIDEHGNLRSEQTHEFKDSPLGRIPSGVGGPVPFGVKADPAGYLQSRSGVVQPGHPVRILGRTAFPSEVMPQDIL